MNHFSDYGNMNLFNFDLNHLWLVNYIYKTSLKYY